MDEKFTDRSESTLDTPSKQMYTKSGIVSELSVPVTNGHPGSSVTSTPAQSLTPSVLTDDQIEDAVFSTTSIDKENKVSTDANLKSKAKDHMFSSSSSQEEQLTELLPPAVTSPKKEEEVRSYYTPGFSIRAWAFEDIKQKKDEPETSKITHVETKERKSSVTSTLTINKNKDYDLEKKESKELSSLTFNVGKSQSPNSPRKETSSVELMLSKTVDYDLQNLSPQKKELSQATFDIGRKSSSGSESKEDSSVTNNAIVSPKTTEMKSDSVFVDDIPLATEELNQRNLQKTKQVDSTTVNTSAENMSSKSSAVKTSVYTGRSITDSVTDEWVIISEEDNIENEVAGKVTSQVLQSTAPSKPVLPPVEIERKFTVGEDTDSRIKKSGAILKSEKSFTDVYWDTEDYILTLADCWLRKRDSKWQMKVPVHSYQTFDSTTKYLELTDEKEIITFVAEKLGVDLGKKSNMGSCLKKAKLVDFATITTTRKAYTLNGCEVDLDSTSDGFKVGEIEILAPSPSEIPSALRTIDSVAKQLGWSPLQLVF